MRTRCISSSELNRGKVRWYVPEFKEENDRETNSKFALQPSGQNSRSRFLAFRKWSQSSEFFRFSLPSAYFDADVSGHQTIESAVVTVAIYGGFAVGYAALWIARKFWLIPVCALLQAAAITLIANIFRAGIIAGRKEFERQLVALGACAILAIVVGYIAFINFVRREGSIFSNPNRN